MSMVIQEVERIIHPRHTPGVDWGADRVVLFRNGNREVIWMLSCKAWQDRLVGYQHEPARLILFEHSSKNRLGIEKKTLHEGGRLSAALIKQYSKEIDEFLGVPGISAHFNRKATVIAEERKVLPCSRD